MAIILTPPAAYEELEIVLEHHQDIYGTVRMTLMDVDGIRREEREDKLELNVRSEEIERALASISRGSARQAWVKRSGSMDRLDPMREMGERLYSALFRGARARFLRRSLDKARYDSGNGLRLRLRTNNVAWASLPWEFLHDGQEFISLSSWSPLVRTAGDAEPLAPRPLHAPLRVLAVTADATGDRQAQKELDLLNEVAEWSPDLKIRPVPQATRDEFIQAVEANEFHVLHFVGGARRLSHGQAALVLMRPDREPLADTDYSEPGQLVDGPLLQKLLADKPELRLIHLSSCHTTELAAELAGVVPATMGMLGSISAQACIDFTGGLYTSILDGVPLEVSVTGGRQAVDMRHSGSREWGLPVLNLQVSNGFRLVPGPDEADVEDASPAADEETAAEPPSDPGDRREWSRLKKLREMYMLNLEELMARVETSLGEPSDLVESQIQETKEQIAKLDEQCRALEGDGG